jgi:hypothetical protein
LSSLSGDRIWSACEASNGVGNGIDDDLDVRRCDEGMGKEYTLCGRVSVDDVIAQGLNLLDVDPNMALSAFGLALVEFPNLDARWMLTHSITIVPWMNSTSYLCECYFPQGEAINVVNMILILVIPPHLKRSSLSSSENVCCLHDEDLFSSLVNLTILSHLPLSQLHGMTPKYPRLKAMWAEISAKLIPVPIVVICLLCQVTMTIHGP